MKLGNVVIIQSDERNRNKWKLGTMESLIPGRDGIVRVARLRSGKNTLERAVKQLYPLELSCDIINPKGNNRELNATVEEFRPRRDAAAAARARAQDIIEEEEHE